MHANALRVYTILPPSFYRALRAWNVGHPRRPLWLVHGVWTELPPEHDFDDPEWKAAFRSEMRSVVDLVHGAAELPPRPGHASGRYDADVSRWTLAYIIGREWEPYAVKAYDSLHPGRRALCRPLPRGRQRAGDGRLDGRAVRLPAGVRGGPVERAPADRVHQLADARPAVSTPPNPGPPRSGSGAGAPGGRLPATSSSTRTTPSASIASLVRPTSRNPAGWFASYHAYPYYPDFLLYDPGYRQARSSEGPSAYFGYLSDLHRHHAGMPFVISEYGVPSSRGNAHLQPQGWDHGGHDERAMAAIDARLTREIRESGAAGAIVFAWMDEWFKKNWIVIDFEQPAERNRLWLNAMDAEQNYGILGQYAGQRGDAPGAGRRPRHAGARSTAVDSGAGALRTLRAGSDEAYLYLALELARGPVAWDSLELAIALDTYLPSSGQRSLPDGLLRSDIGFEFLVDPLRSPGRGRRSASCPRTIRTSGETAIVDGDDFGRFYRRPATIGVETDGRFDPMFVITNRARFGQGRDLLPGAGLRPRRAAVRDRGRNQPGRLVRRFERRPDRTSASVGAPERDRSLEPHRALRPERDSSAASSAPRRPTASGSARSCTRPAGTGASSRRSRPQTGALAIVLVPHLDLADMGGADLTQPPQAGVRFSPGDLAQPVTANSRSSFTPESA